MQLPDEDVRAAFDKFVEAWEQHEVAESQFRTFKATNADPMAMGQTFDGIESFMQFNEQRRAHVEHREELRRNQEASAEVLQEHNKIIRVLLPRVSTLIHHHAGSRYVIRNKGGQVTVSRTEDA